MKKLAAFLLAALAATASVAPAVADDFDTTLRTAASELIGEAEANMSSVAVVAIRTDWGASVADYIQSELEYYFVKKLGAGNVVSRDDFTKSLIANEIDYNRSGVVSDETLQEWGEIIGVETLISGEFSDIAAGWQLILKATQTKTGKHLAMWRGRLDANDADIAYLIQKDGKSRPGFTPPAQAVAASAAATKASKTKAAPATVKVNASWDFGSGKNSSKIPGVTEDSKAPKYPKNITVSCDKGSGATLEILGGAFVLYYASSAHRLCTSAAPEKKDLLVITTENECTLVVVGHGSSSASSFDPVKKVNGFSVNGKDARRQATRTPRTHGKCRSKKAGTSSPYRA